MNFRKHTKKFFTKKKKKGRNRDQRKNATYHTMSRCIDKSNLLQSKMVKSLLYEVIAKSQKKYRFKLHDFVFVDNHMHLMIKTLTEKDTISVIMQFIKALFAREYNKRYNRTGPFWNERFKDSIIEDADNPIFYANYLNWYFGYNAVRKNYVNDPRHYDYCGINCYLDRNYKGRLQIDPHEYYLGLHNDPEQRIRLFLEFENIILENHYS